MNSLRRRQFVLPLLVISLLILLSGYGCSDGFSENAPGLGTGQFLDSAVEGLTYTSGNESGVTDENGTFIYEVGQPVIFSLGGISIGQATGRAILTPVNLVSGGTSSNSTVLNITRFLMCLDSDGDLNNGITISQAVIAAAANWSQPDFTTADLATEIAGIILDIETADSRTVTLPDAATAKSHLDATVFGALTSLYTGTYTGTSSGTWTVVVDALSGQIIGIGHSNTHGLDMAISGQVNVDGTNSFAAGIALSTATWSGTVSPSGTISGTWSDVPFGESGTLTGSKMTLSLPSGANGDLYIGTYTGDGVGMFSIAVDGSGNIEGTGYSVNYGSVFSITGTLVGNAIAIGGTTIGPSFTGILAADGTFSGTWSDGIYSGIFSGCKAI